MPPATALTVTAYTDSLKEVLEGSFPPIWVVGEVTSLSRPPSGHIYFTLKDSASQLPCTIWRTTVLRLKFDPKSGTEVFARGRPTFYGPQGKCQFTVDALEPKGLGAADVALKRLKEKLLLKGYFAPERKRPLPRYPRRVALVASSSGAAVRDMVELLAQRWPCAEVIVRHSRVQGDGSAAELANAVRLLNHLHASGGLRFDAIVLGRGGGSAEDLAAFNEEVVADAIFASLVPVVSAVGHETDVTIADLVADKRAETPSAAIVALTPDRSQMLRGFLEVKSRLDQMALRRIGLSRQRLDAIAARPAFRKPLERVRDAEQKLDGLAARLQRTMKQRLDRDRARVAAVAEQLGGLSPLNVLARGYSLTIAEDGRVVRTTDQVQAGERLVTKLAAGEIVSRVE